MTESSIPRWPCPACKRGLLQLNVKHLNFYETSDSVKKREREEPGYWEPDLPFWRFCVPLICKLCAEPVMTSGYTGDEQEPDGGGLTWKHYLYPVFFHPPLEIISVPEKCPKPVRKEIQAAFALFWCDKLSCANRLRNAVELLLTELGIPLTEDSSDRRLRLHRRIEIFNAKDEALATRLFALKWVGNEGSHPGKLSEDDLLDALEILEDTLEKIFVPPKKDLILEMAKTIHKAKKPRSQHP